MSLRDINKNFVCPNCGGHQYGSNGGGRGITSLVYTCHVCNESELTEDQCFQVAQFDTRNVEVLEFHGGNLRGKDLLNWIGSLDITVEGTYELLIRRVS